MYAFGNSSAASLARPAGHPVIRAWDPDKVLAA
jgi:hypothetical protein